MFDFDSEYVDISDKKAVKNLFERVFKSFENEDRPGKFSGTTI